MLTGMIFGFRAWIRIYLCFRTFMKSKSLLQIVLHAFVLSIMNVNLLFCYFLFYFDCSVHFSAFVANKDIYYIFDLFRKQTGICLRRR